MEELKLSVLPGPEDFRLYIKTDKNNNAKVIPSALAEFISTYNRYIWIKGKGDRPAKHYWYTNGVYREVTPAAIKNCIRECISAYDPDLPSVRIIDEVYKLLVWDPRYATIDELNTDENIINFENGILHLDTMELTRHTDLIHSTIQIPCEWSPEAVETPVFDKYLDDLTEGDPEKKELILQFMGVTLSNINAAVTKKALCLKGEGNTGKSQIRNLMERLIGSENYAVVDLDTLEARFGTSLLVGKRLAGTADMSTEYISSLKMFKTILGNDSVPAEYKGENAIHFHYRGTLWYCCNELPAFGGDRGSWVYDRFIIIECNNVIPEDERDPALCDKMYEERAGIVYKAVQALKRVIENGCNYTIPSACDKAIKIYKHDNSPVAVFLDECCCDLTGSIYSQQITVSAIHDAFLKWCKLHSKGYSCTLKEFKKEVSIIMGTPFNQICHRNKYGSVFPFSLTTEAMRRYT